MLIMIIILLLLEGKKEIPTIKVKPINTILLRKRNSNYYFYIKRKCHMKYTFHKAFVICCSWLPSVLFINISFFTIWNSDMKGIQTGACLHVISFHSHFIHFGEIINTKKQMDLYYVFLLYSVVFFHFLVAYGRNKEKTCGINPQKRFPL